MAKELEEKNLQLLHDFRNDPGRTVNSFQRHRTWIAKSEGASVLRILLCSAIANIHYEQLGYPRTSVNLL